MLENRYSGDNSRDFWEVINILDDKKLTLYEMGCKLQKLEHVVLCTIEKRRQFIERLKTAPNTRIKQGPKRAHVKHTS